MMVVVVGMWNVMREYDCIGKRLGVIFVMCTLTKRTYFVS